MIAIGQPFLSKAFVTLGTSSKTPTANIFTKSKKKRMDLIVLNLLDGISAGRLDETVTSA